MANTSVARVASPALSLYISTAVHALVQRLSDYKAYRKTVSELSNLDSATLTDLGMHRSGIRAEASKAVYGR